MKHKTLWISATIFTILAIIFAFADLSISHAIANPDFVWAGFLEAYGQMPGMFVAFLGSSILLRLKKWDKKFWSILAGIGLFILTTFIAMGFWGEALGQQVGRKVNYMLALGLAIAMVTLFQVWFRRYSDEKMEVYREFGKIAVWLFFLAGFLTVWGIKIPWGRWTYRDMLEINDFSHYSPWFIPQGNNGHHSFISGHTSLSFLVLPIVLFFRNNQKSYQIAWAIALTWGIIVAASRVVIGAHFSSDVLFGGGQTILWFWVLRRKILTDYV